MCKEAITRNFQFSKNKISRFIYNNKISMDVVKCGLNDWFMIRRNNLTTTFEIIHGTITEINV